MTKKVSENKTDEIKKAVKEAYSNIAEGQNNQEPTTGCCGSSASKPVKATSDKR
ncbi:MAG: hypothetical protein ACFFF9_04935 [Candidatus Thorarchaeota archaeon]